MDEHTARMIQNNLTLHAAVQQVVAESISARPQNTRRAYDKKRDDFVIWCRDQAFTDGSLVTEAKIVHYIQSVVMPRGNGKIVDGAAQQLSGEGLEGYVKPLIDLYSTQQSLQPSAIPHPRGKALKELLRTHKRKRAIKKRLEYHDRGEGTVQDAYTMEELKRVASHFMQMGTKKGLRDRMDLLLGHVLMARGESTRKMTLPDLFSMTLPDEGPSECYATMVIMDQGKVNQFGRVEYGGFLRHRDVEVCAVGALAMYFFWRYHVAGEAFPDMRCRASWYDVHVVDGRDPVKEITYSSQARSLKKAMEACGVQSAKVTHIRRVSSCVIAEQNGAGEDSIRRGGRWTNSKMEGCYLTTLPKPVLRALAGFKSEGGTYLLRRGECEVPEALSAMVFPKLDEAQAVLDQSRDKEIAGQGFLQLLKHLRVAFIQDSVLLKLAYPDHPLWKDPFFATHEYRTFASSALNRLQQPEQDVLVSSVQQAMPIMSNIVDTGLRTIDRRLTALETGVQGIQVDLSRIVRGGVRLVFATEDQEKSADSVGQQCKDSASGYVMSRALQTVVEVWNEYDVGLGAGPSIRSLELAQGARWRSTDAERKFFSRRKVYYDAIEYLASSHGLPTSTVAEQLEARRKKDRLTLDAMMRRLKANGPANVFAGNED